MDIQKKLNEIERQSTDTDIYDDPQKRMQLSEDVHELIKELETELGSEGFSISHDAAESIAVKKREDNGKLITAWLEESAKRTVQTGEMDEIKKVDVSMVRESIWKLLEPLKRACDLQRVIDERIDMRTHPENW